MKIIQPSRLSKKSQNRKVSNKALSEPHDLLEQSNSISPSKPASKSTYKKQREFNNDNLQSMPTDACLDTLPKGKKRRRSELIAEKSSNSLVLESDPAKKEFNELFARGVRLLAMREHSVKEMTDKLSSKSENSTAIQAVIDELLENKYLSEQRFTESYIRSRANRGFGPIKIKAELKNKGVSNDLIQDNLQEGAARWLDGAQSEYQKKYAANPCSDYKSWTKRARFMQSRGFSMEHIHTIIPRPEFD